MTLKSDKLKELLEDLDPVMEAVKYHLESLAATYSHYGYEKEAESVDWYREKINGLVFDIKHNFTNN